MNEVLRASRARHPEARKYAVALGVALAVLVGLVGSAGLFGDLSQAGNPPRFVALLLLAGGVYFAAERIFEHVPQAARPRFFWTAAILLRLVALPMTPGDDFWRYIWEGRVVLAGFNPYLLSPQAAELASLRDATWPLINNPSWAAIYPPGAQLLFAKLAAFSVSPLFFKCVFLLADLLTNHLLLRLNTGVGRYRATAWYAWNPAVVILLIGGAHFDVVMLLALVAAVWALHRANPMGRMDPAWSWSVLSAVFLGLAISLKVTPVFLVPLWAVALGRRWWVAAASLAVPALLTLPFGGPTVVMGPLREFASVTRFNDLVWWMVDAVWANPAQRNGRYVLILAVVVLVLTVWLRKDWRRGAVWILGAVLILSPVLHPWYVTWILPLAAWQKLHAWSALSLSATVALLAWEDGPFWSAWEMTWSLRLAVILPPVAALAWSMWRHRADEAV